MISGTRTERLLDRISKEIFQQGRRPTQDEITRELRKFQDILDTSKPSMRFRPFQFRKPIRLEDLNSMEEEISDDLDLLFEEHVAQASRLLTILDRGEIYFRSVDRQLRLTESKIQDIILTSKNAEALLFAVTDTLVDAQNIDQDQTTAALDFVSGVATLPENAVGAKRVPLPHLTKTTTWPIVVRASDGSVITETRGSQGVKRQDVSHVSPFGNAFDDLITAWQFTVTRDEDDPTTVEFTIPLVDPGQAIREIRIGRVDIDPASSSAVQIGVLHSLDGVNFTVLEGHETPPIVDRPITMRFPETLVEQLKITLTKNRADEILPDGKAVFSFGLKNLAVYVMGYAPEAVIRTNALKPQDSDSLPAVNKVTLVADEQIPEGTTIDYFVALNQTPVEFEEIAPVGRPKPGVPQVLQFAGTFDSPRHENRFQILSTPTVFSTRNGISYYEILDTVKSGSIFGTARLYRGVNGWHKQVESLVVEKTVTNEVKFEADANIPLYLIAEAEEPRILTSGVEAQLGVRKDILTQGSSTAPRGSAGKRNPNYAIESLIYYPEPAAIAGAVDVVEHLDPEPGDPNRKIRVIITGGPSLMAGDVVNISDSTLGRDWPNLTIVGLPNVTETSTTMVLTVPEGTDRPPVSIGAGDLTIIRRDVTADIESFSGSVINLQGLTVSSNDRFEVTYRYSFSSNHELTTSGIIVSDGTQQDVVYLPGIDYALDVSKRTITRIPTGSIPSQGLAIVEIPYKERRPGREIYTTYVRVGQPAEVELPGLSLDQEARESALMVVEGQVFDLSESGPITIPRGFHQVQVFSRPLVDPNGSTQTNSAIYKVINISVGTENLFAKERFFQLQSAFIAPLQQTSLTKLTGSVRKTDHGFFAINGTKVIINYDPTTADEILYLLPGQAAPANQEEFELAYKYVPSTPETNEVLLKAVLRRQEDKPSITPVLKSYSLRFA